MRHSRKHVHMSVEDACAMAFAVGLALDYITKIGAMDADELVAADIACEHRAADAHRDLEWIRRSLERMRRQLPNMDN